MPNGPPAATQALAAFVQDITAGPQILTFPLNFAQGGTNAITGQGAMNNLGAFRTVNGTTPIQINGALSATLGADITISVIQFTAALAGIVPASGGSATNFLNGSGTWTVPTGALTSLTMTASTGLNLSPSPWTTGAATIAGVVFGPSGGGHTIGMVPDPGAGGGVTRFLREDATWQNALASVGTMTVTALNGIASSTNPWNPGTASTTITGVVFGISGGGHSIGMVPDPGAGAGTTRALFEDGTWKVPIAGGGLPAANDILFSTGAAIGGDSIFSWVDTTHSMGIGTAAPAASLQILTDSPGSVAGSNGTSAQTAFYVQGGTGGAVTSGVFTGGSGSNLFLRGGDGGASTAGPGGAGGPIVLLAGSGGSGGTSAGAGGQVSILAGPSNATGTAPTAATATFGTSNAPANANSGTVFIQTGTVSGSGVAGNVVLQSNTSGKVNVNHSTASPSAQLDTRCFGGTSNTPIVVNDARLSNLETSTVCAAFLDGDNSGINFGSATFPSVYIQRFDKNVSTTTGWALEVSSNRGIGLLQGGLIGGIATSANCTTAAGGGSLPQIGIFGQAYDSAGLGGTLIGVQGRAFLDHATASVALWGMQAISLNKSAADAAVATNAANSMVALAVLGDGLHKQTAGIQIGTNNGGTTAFQSGIIFDVNSVSQYGIDFNSMTAISLTFPIRLMNNGQIAWRNAANGADIGVMRVDASNRLNFGNPTAIFFGSTIGGSTLGQFDGASGSFLKGSENGSLSSSTAVTTSGADTAFSKVASVPAANFANFNGLMVRFTAWGVFTTTGAPGTITVKLKVANNAALTTSPIVFGQSTAFAWPASQTGQPWQVQGGFLVRAAGNGANNCIIVPGSFQFSNGATAVNMTALNQVSGTISIDTTADHFLGMMVNLSVGSQSITQDGFYLEVLGPNRTTA